MSGTVKLKSITITGKSHGPKLLILGGIHGDEFESMWAIRRLKEGLDSNELRGSVTLVPVVNEAAYWRGQRTAEDGLDLARTCPGKEDGTITERVAFAVSALIREADYLIDLHSGGLVSRFYPTVGYMLHPDAGVLEKQREMARAFNLPIVWGTYAHHEGRTLSIARDARHTRDILGMDGSRGLRSRGGRWVLRRLSERHGRTGNDRASPAAVADRAHGGGRSGRLRPYPAELPVAVFPDTSSPGSSSWTGSNRVMSSAWSPICWVSEGRRSCPRSPATYWSCVPSTAYTKGRRWRLSWRFETGLTSLS